MKPKIADENAISSFIEGQDDDGHFSLLGDVESSGIIDCESPIHCCKFNPSGDLFAVGLSNGSIKMFNKKQNQLIYVLIDDDIKNTRLPVTSLRFFNPPNDPNQDHYKILIASYVSGFVKFWHYPSKSCIYTIKDKQIEPLTLDLNSKADKIAVAGYNDYVNIYDIQTKKLISTLEPSEANMKITGHSSRIYCVKYNEGNQLISGGWDDTVQFWDDRLPQSQNYIYGPHVCGESIDVDNNHNHLLTGSWRKNSTLQIWDMRNLDLIRDTFKNHSNMMIYGCHWLASSYIFMGGGEKNSALVYDRGNMKPVAGLIEIKDAVTSIDNDRIGEFPNLLVATRNLLYLIKPKNKSSSYSASLTSDNLQQHSRSKREQNKSNYL